MHNTAHAREFVQPDLGCTVQITEYTSPPELAGQVLEVAWQWNGAEGDNAAALARAESLLDAAGRLPRSYDPEAADHLRIYGVATVPTDLVGRYLAHRPPTEYDWGLAGLQKVTTLTPPDRGDIPLMTYLNEEGGAVARRTFSFSYGAQSNGAVTLTVTETPGWCRNDGAWVEGPSKTQVYTGARYNAWRDSARQRIFEGLKTWLPAVLVALEVSTDIPDGEADSGAWLANNHAAPWNLYMATGREEAITHTLTNVDQTAWLNSTVPEGVVDGVSGGTVREMILGALR